jgi:hypothetical protein
MPITPEQFQEMLRRVEQNAGRLSDPIVADDAVEEELPLHGEILQWCKEQYPMVPCVHARPDKRSGVTKGTPDFILAYRGKVFWIEVKDREGKRSTDQLAFAMLLEMQGLKAYVVRSKREFLEIVSNA